MKIRNREAHEPWQKHHFIAKELMRNFNNNGIVPSIFDQLKLQEEFQIITEYKYHH